MTDTDEWAEQLRANRREKDRFLAEHRQSPIPPDLRDAFDGLDYFEPDPDYRIEAEATVYDDPGAVTMETSDGREVRYLRVVTFAFELDGQEHTLAGYQQDHDEGNTIFVPFRDKTTGQQTYHGGRYIELEAEDDLEDGEVVPIDFNLAYSPFCAYSETFSCPLPPEENWLEIAIEAGERAPDLG
jgi:uncharacterized protein (DUF1684 family)